MHLACTYGWENKDINRSFIELFIERPSVGGIGQEVCDSGVDLKWFSIMSVIPLHVSEKLSSLLQEREL